MRNFLGGACLALFVLAIFSAPFIANYREQKKEDAERAATLKIFNKGQVEDAFLVFINATGQGKVNTPKYVFLRGIAGYHPGVEDTFSVYTDEGKTTVACFDKKTDGKWYVDVVSKELETDIRAELLRTLSEWLRLP